MTAPADTLDQAVEQLHTECAALAHAVQRVTAEVAATSDALTAETSIAINTVLEARAVVVELDEEQVGKILRAVRKRRRVGFVRGGS